MMNRSNDNDDDDMRGRLGSRSTARSGNLKEDDENKKQPAVSGETIPVGEIADSSHRKKKKKRQTAQCRRQEQQRAEEDVVVEEQKEEEAKEEELVDANASADDEDTRAMIAPRTSTSDNAGADAAGAFAIGQGGQVVRREKNAPDDDVSLWSGLETVNSNDSMPPPPPPPPPQEYSTHTDNDDAPLIVAELVEEGRADSVALRELVTPLQAGIHQEQVVEGVDSRPPYESYGGDGAMQDDPNLPPSVPAKAVEYKPWYKRPPILIGLGLLVAGAIGVTLGVTLQDNDGGNPVDTMSPTASPAPTGQAVATMVMQLDEKSQETGWALECDEVEIQRVPEGSYAFLPIGVLIPSFRLEITVDVVVGSECLFNITDAGGDGLLGGFYEIYLGNDVGNADNLIAKGVSWTQQTLIPFVVDVPPAAFEPSAAPVTPPPGAMPSTQPSAASDVCTVCHDGSPVPNPNLVLPWSGMTCGEMDSLAMYVANTTECKKKFQSLARDCGCENFCGTLCPDGSLIDESQEETLVRVDRGLPVTCGDIQDQVMARKSRASDCLTAGFIGEEICMCPSEGSFCRICEPGGPTQVPGHLSREIIPGIACEDISGIAFSLRRSDPRFSLICPALFGVGAYCGCPEVENPRTFCRLCGGTNDLLPVPDRVVFSPTLNQTTTCFHVEFFANLGIEPNGTTLLFPDCSVVQEESAAECCT